SFHGVNLENYKHALSQIYYHHLTPSKFRVQAINHPLELKQWNLEDLDQEIARIEMPALIRGYIKLGATFGNGAYIDFDFNSIDVFTLIDMETINRRYLDKFMKSL
ncbi:MAG: hypothetical protein PHX62_04665, partial [Bacilli bacterium]|nr:hypothetical protein [Bacilli bacterium]